MLDYRSLIEMENITWRELRVIFVSLPTPFFHPNLSHSHHLKFYFFAIHSFNSNLETSLSKYSLKKSFYQNTTKFFQTRISKISLSKIYLSSFSSFLFFFILISSTIFSRSRFEFDRSLHDHPSKRWIVRYDAPNDILCSNNSRVFHSLAGELA